jgi:cytochrome c peroxidase
MKYPRIVGWFYPALFGLLAGLLSCHDSIDGPQNPEGDLTGIPYNPVPYVVEVPVGFPALEQPEDNLMTVDGILLGRKLFYDPLLSLDSTISCSSCHKPSLSFTDGLAKSVGVAGTTSRSSIGLINVGFHYSGLFWDGRASTLEQLALIPIEDPIEMAESLDNVELKLKNHPGYPSDFRKAFGIENKEQIDRFLAAKAIAQFLRTIVSGQNSKYDKAINGELFLEENELNGYLMFFNLDPTLPDAQCGHCHNAPLLASNDFFNNGLQASPDLFGFEDKGLGAITGIAGENGFFKPPTLRNLVFTAPYMHDGRFNTLEEVIDHYTSGGKDSPNKSSFMFDLVLTESQKSDILAFLLTLTDSTVLSNPAYQNPF